MDQRSLDFLKNLLHAPSPSGYEQPVQQVVREFVEPFAADVTTDWHGNVVAAINPAGTPRIMLAGHCDQIGLMVKHIDDKGYLWVDPIGGWDIQMLIGQNMVVHNRRGPVPGVIARKAIHLLKPEERKKVPEIDDLWIDIGVKDREQAEELVALGDPVTFELRFRELQNGLATAPGMDNKVGAWVVMNALKQIAAETPAAAVFAVSTVQEELGLRGAKTSAYAIQPRLGIAVDVTHATDCPTVDKQKYGEVHIGDGPVVYRGPNVNPVMHEQLKTIANEKEIPTQIAGISRPAGNDANAMQINQAGMATAIVAIPNRYMHSPVEVVSLVDLENAARLIAEFCLSLSPESDFTP